MRSGSVVQGLAVTMVAVLIFSTTVWAAEPEFAGSLRTSGVVLTNYVQLPDGGTVRSGDRITTKPGGLAVISSAAHGRLEVRPNSEARLAPDHVALHHGAVAATNIPITIGDYTIQPQDSARAWYAVASRDGRLIVAAHRGALLIASGGGPPMTLTEGSFALHESEQDTSGQSNEKDKGKKKKGGAAAGAAASGWTIGGLSHAASVALIVGVGAGVAATAAGVAVALSDDAPRPQC